jgi:hypothetical protein
MRSPRHTAGAPALLACALLVLGCGAGARLHRATSASCLPGVAAALARASGAGAVRARPLTGSPGIRGCRYESGAVLATVTVDANPQAYRRWARALVETDQTALWSHDPTLAPRVLSGIATGADWVPADGELSSSDGRRLVTVRVERGRDPERLARAATIAALAALRAR